MEHKIKRSTWYTFLICFTLSMLALIPLGVYVMNDTVTNKSISKKQFVRGCTLSKGIAVYDVDGKMACVPTFSYRNKL